MWWGKCLSASTKIHRHVANISHGRSESSWNFSHYLTSIKLCFLNAVIFSSSQVCIDLLFYYQLSQHCHHICHILRNIFLYLQNNLDNCNTHIVYLSKSGITFTTTIPGCYMHLHANNHVTNFHTNMQKYNFKKS